MPELPDLQVFSFNLNKKLKGKKLKEIKVPVSGKLNVSVKKLQQTLTGQSVKAIYREGKELQIEFNKGDVLALHLMLHGNLYLVDAESLNKHSILELIFNDGKILQLTDWQKAATSTLNPPPKEAPDALSKEMTPSFLKEKLQKKAIIKNVLLDQKVVRGIGNAYADEILWDAGISPFSVSNKIPENKIKVLHRSIGSVLKKAEKEIRKAKPDTITGEYRDFLLIHNSKKKESPSGSPIRYKVMGGRKTYYTNEQELFD
jgi:formamidopyrimidine-DNA glycosylase